MECVDLTEHEKGNSEIVQTPVQTSLTQSHMPKDIQVISKKVVLSNY